MTQKDGTEFDEELLEEARDRAPEYILPGFLERDEVAEYLGEELDLDEDDPLVQSVIAEVWDKRKAEEVTWAPGSSDFERLDGAFDQLNGEGILALMDFSGDDRSGHIEIGAERTPREDAGEDDYPYEEWGYTFFHEQDSLRLLEDPPRLMLGFGSFVPLTDTDPELLAAAADGDEGAEDAIRAHGDHKVAERVVEVLRDHGFTVDWEGDPTRRIEVKIHQWRKPLPE